MTAAKEQGRNTVTIDVPKICNQDKPDLQRNQSDACTVRSIGPTVGAIIDEIDGLSLSEVGGLNELARPWYSDQILPFDVTLAGCNEYGAMCSAKIFGVEILNEGQGISIDDAVSEMQATFVARAVEPMQAVKSSWSTGSFPPSGLFRTFQIRYRNAFNRTNLELIKADE